jgi:hypothetical protein
MIARLDRLNRETAHGFAAAFAAGLFAQRLLPPAEAQSGPAPLTPQIINLVNMTDEEIGNLVPNTDLRSRLLAATPDGTISVQSGNVARHYTRTRTRFS